MRSLSTAIGMKPGADGQAGLLQLGKPGGLLDAKDDLSTGPVLLITDLSLSANNRNNPTPTAGTPFMGQFVAHDIAFDTTSKLGVTTDPGTSPNARTPSLDLDSVYGAGPVASAQLYDPSDKAVDWARDNGYTGAATFEQARQLTTW